MGNRTNVDYRNLQPWVYEDGRLFNLKQSVKIGFQAIVYILYVEDGKGVIPDDSFYIGSKKLNKGFTPYVGSSLDKNFKEFVFHYADSMERIIISRHRTFNNALNTERKLLLAKENGVACLNMDGCLNKLLPTFTSWTNANFTKEEKLKIGEANRKMWTDPELVDKLRKGQKFASDACRKPFILKFQNREYWFDSVIDFSEYIYGDRKQKNLVYKIIRKKTVVKNIKIKKIRFSKDKYDNPWKCKSTRRLIIDEIKNGDRIGINCRQPIELKIRGDKPEKFRGLRHCARFLNTTSHTIKRWTDGVTQKPDYIEYIKYA